MQGQDERALAALRSILRPSHVMSPDDLGAIIDAAGRELGATRAVVYVVDYDQVLLVPLTTVADMHAVAVDGTLAGRAFTEVTQVTASADDGGSPG